MSAKQVMQTLKIKATKAAYPTSSINRERIARGLHCSFIVPLELRCFPFSLLSSLPMDPRKLTAASRMVGEEAVPLKKPKFALKKPELSPIPENEGTMSLEDFQKIMTKAKLETDAKTETTTPKAPETGKKTSKKQKQTTKGQKKNKKNLTLLIPSPPKIEPAPTENPDPEPPETETNSSIAFHVLDCPLPYHPSISFCLCTFCHLEAKRSNPIALPTGKTQITFYLCQKCVEVNFAIQDVLQNAVNKK